MRRNGPANRLPFGRRFPLAKALLRVGRTDAAHIDDIFLSESRDPFQWKQVSVYRIEVAETQQNRIVVPQQIFKKLTFDVVGMNQHTGEIAYRKGQPFAHTINTTMQRLIEFLKIVELGNKPFGAQQQLKADDYFVPGLGWIGLSCFVPAVVRHMDHLLHGGMENFVQLQLMVQTFEHGEITFALAGAVASGGGGIKLFVNKVNQIESSTQPEKDVEIAQHTGCIDRSAVAFLNQR